jgi:hypothetical protein
MQAILTLLERLSDMAEMKVIVDDIFGLRLTEHVACKKCSTICHNIPEHMEYSIMLNVNEIRQARLLKSKDTLETLGRTIFNLDHAVGKMCDRVGCNTSTDPTKTLSSQPAVLKLHLVWDEKVREVGDIEETMAFIDQELDINDIYGPANIKCVSSSSMSTSSMYKLTGMICYYGRHYYALLCDNDGPWTMYDDSSVVTVGSWEAVRAKCKAGRIQPNVLFYTSTLSA